MRARWSTALLLGFLLIIAGIMPAWAQEPVHVVQAGETLSTIAARYGVSAQALAQANQLTNRDWIYVGQRLRIPSQGSGASVGYHVVSYGESLTAIAWKYGVSVEDLVRANGLPNPNFVFAGQRLVIPSGGAGAASVPTEAGGETTHIVQAGQTLTSIAASYGVSVSALMQANGLRNQNFIYVGQRLRIPAPGSAPAPSASAASAPVLAEAPYSGRWIDVNLSTQTLTAYEGSIPVFTTLVSTGLPATPTVTGHFKIYSKYTAIDMAGPGYYLPAVPWTMFFYRGYALHGAYWHNNFGHPMSHGCVNLSVPDAKWLFEFASIGTPVVVHY
ncbi:MAG: LysM peptidoglycan-binding domain-containing protein [Anaerolineae bacterium]